MVSGADLKDDRGAGRVAVKQSHARSVGARPSLLNGCGFRRPHCLSHCLAFRAALCDALCRDGEMHCSITHERTACARHAGVDKHKSYTRVWVCVW